MKRVSIFCITALIIQALLLTITHAAPVKLTMVGWNNTDAFKAIMQIFNESQDQIFIEYRAITGGTYVDTVLTMHAGGVAPDIIHMNPENSSIQFIESGLIRPIDDYIAVDKPDISDVLPGAWWYAKYKGKWYGWPLLGSPLVTTGMLINRDHFAEAGLSLPRENWTYDEFIAIGKKLTLDLDADGVKERYGADMPNRTWNWDWIWSNGGDYVSEDGLTCTLDQPAAYEGLQRMADISLVHGVSPVLGSPGAGNYTYVSQKASMSFRTALANIPAMQSQIKFDWSLQPIPAQAAGSVGRGGSFTIGMSTQSKNTDAIWTFFKWLIKPETERLLVDRGTALLPVNRSVLFAPSYWRLDEAPYDLRPFLNRTPKPFPFIPQWEYINQALKDVLYAAVEPGIKPAKIAMQELAPTLTEYLQRGM
jgi:multiple sugar transport system substrate-binding protein